MTRAFKPWTHQIQWRKPGYWAPGPKFSDEEQATSYAECRAVPEKRGVYRVVPVSKPGELSVSQCLVLMKFAQVEPQHWRARLLRFITNLEKPRGSWTEEELQLMQDIGQTFPLAKITKLNERMLRNKLLMADARERAVEIAKAVSDIVILDSNPEVMTMNEGAFVQAWVFVPKRTEEQERGREHDIAAYLAGETRADAA
ncbi:hypothetical protein HOV23_gp059 [Pseudomonas phage Lana]|uniref:Uncharacterized protein n=1 Tax=Pseudomonas phage Lana TaxID=2530172 RepID=A0A481W5Z4_9CAUD|nr:hypothetical protein HOV23_gp059 [Pseudomonas phage Lana]QBJ04514.1 hypothetical protein [Pseudomonas phage Lana]